MIGISTVNVFNTKIVDNEHEGNGACDMVLGWTMWVVVSGLKIATWHGTEYDIAQVMPMESLMEKL